MKNKKVLKILAVFLMVFILEIFSYQKAEAFLSFGGKIIDVAFCPNGLMLIIGPPNPSILMLTPFSRMFPFFSIKRGSWVLGSYAPGGSCGLIPVIGTITIIGTSK